MSLPHSPSLRGTLGVRGRSRVNVLRVQRPPTESYFQYDVVRPVEGRNGAVPENIGNWKRRFQIVHHAQTVFPQFFQPKALFDGKAIMLSAQNLTGNLPSRTFDVPMSDEPQAPRSTRGVFQVIITRTATNHVINPQRLIDAIQRRMVNATEVTVAINLLQMIISQAANMKYTNNGKSYFSPTGRQVPRDNDGIEFWRGFFHSVRLCRDDILINVDVCMSAVYSTGLLLDVASRWLKVRDLRLRRTEPNFGVLRKFLIGLKVIVQYSAADGHRGRQRTITGLVAEAGEYPFEKTTSAGVETTTVANHLRETRNLRFDPRVFGVRLGDAVIPAQYCFIPSGQLYKKKVPPHLMDQVLTFAKIEPDKRFEFIEMGVAARDGVPLDPPILEYQHSSYVRNAGMEISTQTLIVDSRVLDPPQILYNNLERDKTKSPKYKEVQERDLKKGSWNVTDVQFHKPGRIRSWSVVYFDTGFTDEMAGRNARWLYARLISLGITVDGGPSLIIGGRADNKEEVLEKAWEAARDSPFCTDGQVDLMFFILRFPSNDIRDFLKHWGDVTRGVPTTCMRSDKGRNGEGEFYSCYDMTKSLLIPSRSDQYYRNQALKVNVHVGGINSVARGPILDEVAQVPTMIIGADVSHPGPGSGNPSIAGLVYSLDHTLSRYEGLSQVQAPRTERIDRLGEMIRKAIIGFASYNNNPPPQRIFFYRDGLSDGEIESTGVAEYTEIRDTLVAIWQRRGMSEESFPKISYIIVTKRHHIRFSPVQGSSHRDRKGNAVPGFVVDKGVDSLQYSDFYLMGHAGLLGTSRPGHYIVLRDYNFAFNADKLQAFSYALCFMYAKSTRSVSIPAPVYYADLLCGRGAMYFDPAAGLEYMNDAASMTTVPDANFDLKKWKDAYRGEKIKVPMFFL